MQAGREQPPTDADEGAQRDRADHRADEPVIEEHAVPPVHADVVRIQRELSELANQFTNDRTLKAEAYLAAADVEMGLVGVPKKGVVTMGVDVKELL